MGSRKRSRSRSGSRFASSRRSGIGILFWVCLAVVIVAVVFAAREPLSDAYQRMRGEPVETTTPQVTVRPLEDSPASPPGDSTPASAPPASTGASSSAAASSGGGQTPPASPSSPSSSSSSTQTRVVPARKARLFFATVDDNGGIAVKSVIRSIPASDSPLRDTLVALLKGPTSQELNLGLVSMVPSGAVLRNVTMRGDTAEIDFSDSFRFNAQGVEAMNAQLRQVVYAATEFPTVSQVQILIEGKKVTYLGVEGVRIDNPLSRASFQK